MHTIQRAISVASLALLAQPVGAATFSMASSIDGAQAGTPSNSKGYATVGYDDVSGEMSWNITWNPLEGNISVAHFHGPAVPGVGAGVQVNFGSISGLTSPSIGSAAISAAQGADLLAGLWYINIHSQPDFGGGEIRGQVYQASELDETGVVLDCTGTCDSFDFLDVGSTIDGTITMRDEALTAGSFDGGDLLIVDFLVNNPALPPVGPSDPPNPVTDNPFGLNQSAGGGAVVVANGQDITSPRGTFQSRSSAGTTDGTTLTSGFIDLWVTEGVLANNGAVITLNYTDDCVDEIGGDPVIPAPCFEVNIFEGLIWVAGGSLGPVVVDTDMDGVADSADNCLLSANPTQLDTDGDGIGNICDGDFTQDCQTNFLDLGTMKANFFMPGNLPTDMNGDATTNFIDLGQLKGVFFAPPGPSGIPNDCD